jgi:F0F1-type ATP synthase membrane subunit b/b'
MEILYKLGIDSTFFYQMAIFCVTYVFLSRLVFKPYLKIHHKRIEATFGHQEHAEKLNEQARDLHHEYETKARAMNTKVQSYFEDAHKEAQTYQASTMEKARKEASDLVHKTRDEIQKEVQKTRGDLKKLIPDISHDIQRKILSREA